MEKEKKNEKVRIAEVSSSALLACNHIVTDL